VFFSVFLTERTTTASWWRSRPPPADELVEVNALVEALD